MVNSNFAGSISKTVNSWTDAIEAAKNANYRIVSVRINGTDSQNLPTGFNVHWGTIYCNPGGTYGAAILQSFSGDIYTKGLSSGTWTDWQKQPTRAEVDLALKGVKFSLSPGESKVISGTVNYGVFLLSAQISGLGGYAEIINTTNNQITKRTMFSANDSGFTNGVTLAKANGTITITNNASGDGYFALYRLDYYTI